MKKKFIIIIVVILLGLIASGIYYFWEKPIQTTQKLPQNQVTHPSCLRDDETAVFQYIGSRFTATSADISINDKMTGEEKFRFRLDNLIPNIGWPYEFRKCGVYIIREFNWGDKNSKPLPGWNDGLWRYTYDGKGEKILTLANNDRIDYSLDYRVDFLEVYLALIKGYFDRADSATVIKEIKTKEDVFSLKYKDIINKYPELTNNDFSLAVWTKDSRYFWGRVSFVASVAGFFRIERDTWKVDIFLTPPKTTGGTAFNSEYGYLTYDDGAPWSGDVDIDEMYRREWKEENKKVHFYLYNLLTKKQILLAVTDNPIWHFKPQWISDTELEYELPTGEKKIYKINEK